MFTIVHARSISCQLFAASATITLRVCQLMPAPVEPRLARVLCIRSRLDQLVLQRANTCVDCPRAGLLSRMHISAKVTARSRILTNSLCTQCSRCSLPWGPAPHGHCTQRAFASPAIDAFRALFTSRNDRSVGTTPAQIRIMAARALWDVQDRNNGKHIVHWDWFCALAPALSVTHRHALPPHWPPWLAV